MARLQGGSPKLMRIKAGLTADDDYTDPTKAIPGYAGATGVLTSDDPTVARGWSITPRRADGTPLTKIKVKVTFRDNAGAEVAGTFNAVFWALVPRDELEGNAQVRPAVEWLGEVSSQPSKKPVIVDVAGADVMGMSFTSITAVGATKVFVYVQEWV